MQKHTWTQAQAFSKAFVMYPGRMQAFKAGLKLELQP